jgi:hypothetical protein
MKIKIKTQDIEIEYSDDMSEIREHAVKNINTIIEKISLESIRKENSPIPSQVIRTYPNGTGPTFFNACPDIN